MLTLILLPEIYIYICHKFACCGRSFVQVPEQDANAENGTKMTEEMENFYLNIFRC